ncbi:hypothetical protein BJX61DRAFT_85899 [Aspergillus egyptiacus]|nr:hypothetical protein BJX61DRAFT_85899 [Aspergillus egyptiacus]
MASLNGKVPDTGEDVVVVSERRPEQKRTGGVRWTLGLLLRLCIWYFLLTPLFRCPSNLSQLNESSPRVCKPYLVAKSYVEPHVVPYYNAYGAPYVDAARPYVDVLHEKVYAPASNVAKQGYEKYGAPALERAQTYGQQQWDANVVPRVHAAKGKVDEWYGAQVAPHMERVKASVSPYYSKVYGVYWATLDGYIMPFCAKYQPFIGKTYTSGQEILTTTVLPYAQGTWSSAIYFVNNSLWPKISSLYSQNVEPQLVKIGQRLASYREGNRLRGVADEAEGSAGYPVVSSTLTEAGGSASPGPSSVSKATPSPSLSASEIAAQMREKIASDLVAWKERFASASERGVEELEGRVVEIVETYLASGVQANGEELLTALDSAVESQTTAIKRRISELAESLPFKDAPEEEDAAVDQLMNGIRNSAVTIRDRAHMVREWHVSFERDLIQKVSVAVNSTLAVLDNVRDLGLQEIGMRWAWMDGVTYKDWADYHALKAEFEDWKAKFREIGLQHARIDAAKEIADDILSRGMDVAEAAAKELARLKDVGKWKIAAREVSDDFETRSEPPPQLPKPAQQGQEPEVPLDAEGVYEVNNHQPVADEGKGTDSESLENDTIQSPDEDDTSDGEIKSEFAEPKDEAAANANYVPFGASATEVIPDKASVDSDHETNVDHEKVMDAEATKLAESLSQPLVDEEVDQPPIQGQAADEQQAVEDLLRQLIADKGASFAEDVLKKLYSDYLPGSPQPSDASEPIEEKPVAVIAKDEDNTVSPLADAVPDVAEAPSHAADSGVKPENPDVQTAESIETQTTEAADSNATLEDQPAKEEL